MATSYPRRNHSGGIWQVTDVSKNLLEQGTWPGVGSVPGTRAVFGGGADPGYSNIIDYATISTAGNAADFGDLSIARYGLNKGASSFTRGVFTAGEKASPYNTNVLDYITIPSTGNAADFGDLTSAANALTSMTSNGTRGLNMGGNAHPVRLNVISYITIASVGDAIDFGDLSATRKMVQPLSNSTRALAGGGAEPGFVNTIEFVQINSLGNAVDFGNMTATTSRNAASLNDSIRGIWAGGSPTDSNSAQVNTIEYVNIAALGNGTDFGDLVADKYRVGGGTSSSTRGVVAGGMGPGDDTPMNSMDYFTIAQSGNSTDFGDLTDARGDVGAVSDGHGGLEAYDPRLIPVGSGIGFFGGGYNGSAYTSGIDKVYIPSLGNAADFGDLTSVIGYNSCASSGTRGLSAGGDDGPALVNVINSFELQSEGNAADFGDLGATKKKGSGLSSVTRGVFGGGYTPTLLNVIEYVTVTTAANASDFGDLTAARKGPAACSSGTRGVFGGGDTGSLSDVLDYITIASTGDATDFGDSTDARKYLAGFSSALRGCFAGGTDPGMSNIIDYITIASTGNATDFGDLTVARTYLGATSSNVRGIIGGGQAPSGGDWSFKNEMDYITIASTGDAADFGDLTSTRGYGPIGNISDSHGGLSA